MATLIGISEFTNSESDCHIAICGFAKLLSKDQILMPSAFAPKKRELNRQKENPSHGHTRRDRN
jgi:hypothetical protein